VESAYVQMVGALRERETVHVLVPDAAAEEGARIRLHAGGVDPDAGLRFHHVPTDDAWLRDTGPVFLVGPAAAGGPRLLVDFDFDAWGGKYPPWDRDAAVPARVAEITGVPRRRAGFVLEGGSVDGNGRGAVLTTESCLLHANREPGRTREGMERRLRDWLGAAQVLWLAEGIAGDDTDGHVDDVARFTDAGTVVAAVEDDPGDPNHTPLRENLRRLRGMRDAEGKPLAVATLPMPPAHRAAGHRSPASYANFYVANGVVLLPVFGAATDARAQSALGELFPDREVVPVPAHALVVGLGAVHCLTQQEPAATPRSS